VFCQIFRASKIDDYFECAANSASADTTGVGILNKSEVAFIVDIDETLAK
jgi:hypothetical protein